MEDVRLLYLPEKDVGGLSIGSAVSCCMAGDFLQSRKGAVYKLYKASNTVWK